MNIDERVKAIIDLRPWLKVILNILYKFLEYGKANEMFARRFGPK